MSSAQLRVGPRMTRSERLYLMMHQPYHKPTRNWLIRVKGTPTAKIMMES
ncbi:MAG: hypothetical protein ACPGRD_04440 [Planktomarina sp.]